MKICLIGDTQGPRDEGMRNTNIHLVERLKKSSDLFVLKPGESSSLAGIRRIKAFGPHIIHYLQGPTIRSLVLCRALRLIVPEARIVLLAMNPALQRYQYVVLPYLAPHHVLSVTKEFHGLMARVGISSQIVFPGVDHDKFRPVNNETKREIRKSLGIPVDKKIVLHVGHFTEARGVLSLGRLQGESGPDMQFMIVGSSTNKPQSLIVDHLRARGVKVITEFIPDVEKIYQASDAYIFPGDRSDSAIDIPLSILEAMAVNLPIVTTHFGGLPDIFESKPWFKYAESVDGIRDAVKSVLGNSTIKPESRAMVAPYTWDKFAETVMQAYKAVLSRGKNS